MKQKRGGVGWGGGGGGAGCVLSFQCALFESPPPAPPHYCTHQMHPTAGDVHWSLDCEVIDMPDLAKHLGDDSGDCLVQNDEERQGGLAKGAERVRNSIYFSE